MKYILVAVIVAMALANGFYTPHSGPWNNFGSGNGNVPMGALGNPWAESYPGPLGAFANGGFGPYGFGGSPWGFNPWAAAAAGAGAGGDKGGDDSKDDSGDDYWSVPNVAGWIVPNNPDALTPWGVNIADAIPVMSSPGSRRF